MKKLLSLFLALILIVSMCACGKNTNSTDNINNDSVQHENNTDKTDKADEKSDTPTSDYLTYDDLTETETFWIWPEDGEPYSFAISCPSGFRFDSHGNGIGSENSLAYSIVVTHSERPMSNPTLEDAFLTLLNGDDGYHSILRSIDRATYSEMTPETELVTLPCGKQAIKFTGLQNQDDYGTIADCPTYGYCVLYGDVPVIVSYILFEADEVDDATRAELQNYVDEMVNTIRS